MNLEISSLINNFKSICIIKGSIVALLCGLTTLTFKVLHKKKIYEIKRKEEEAKLLIVDKINDSKKQNSFQYQYNQLFIHDLPTMDWVEVGQVENLYAYPLISGNKYAVDECNIKFDGMYMIENNIKMKWDRSFIVFDDLTKYVITAKMCSALSEVNLFVEENYVILQAPDIPCLCIELNNKDVVTCEYWCGNEMLTTPKLICIDCGDEAAEWLSKFLKGKDNNLRLGYITNSLHPMNTYWHCWAKDCILYRKATQNNKSLSPFVNILNSILVTEKPYKKILEKLETFEENMKYCPNIVISAKNYHIEKEWKWIKIGNIIIRNVLPQQTESRPDKIDMLQHIKYFAIGINCDLHLPGRIKVGDNVYAHFFEK